MSGPTRALPLFSGVPFSHLARPRVRGRHHLHVLNYQHPLQASHRLHALGSPGLYESQIEGVVQRRTHGQPSRCNAYHIGNGVFGGLLPLIGLSSCAATGNIYAGLYYPMIVADMTFVVGSLLLKEKHGTKIWDEVGGMT